MIIWLFIRKFCLVQELERSKLVQSDERTIYEVMIMFKELVLVECIINEKLGLLIFCTQGAAGKRAIGCGFLFDHH